MSSQFPKRCGKCGCNHDAASWASLSLVGKMDDGVELLELRNCGCRSTLAIVVGDSPTADTQRDPEVKR